MVVYFENPYLEKLFQGKAVPGKPKYSSDVVVKFKKTILKLKYADNLRELKSQRGLNFEALKGNYKGFYSVRVDYSYRLILSFDTDGNLAVNDVVLVHDLTNHYQ
ncbi:MAG: hypothetical protein ABS85_00130 [Sphingobacteriales bacterium SCN 48-20]|uniref:type II toxin-antitoxin system RelE/ParE family toxin n=1 Tax=Terrimonas ferruginea TaxID=249 RepID=UPI00086F102A|nr:type II toxin-antitoxin system RelE/ParE family toxin [Terrimonas ferruginea]ODT96040.1 MAG: hypothetical protein ABS85_00130 [Sphingobacteriales bacterium SCN 48-20]OJW42995.1 MAG: hypothetical protein BGO56_13285 [Sphingobacteriales bacterium 48-107]